MIQYLTECKTDKTVIHKVEWNTDRITEVEKQYKLGEQSLHKTKRQAFCVHQFGRDWRAQAFNSMHAE